MFTTENLLKTEDLWEREIVLCNCVKRAAEGYATLKAAFYLVDTVCVEYMLCIGVEGRVPCVEE